MAVEELPEGYPFLCGDPISISILESAEKAGKEWKLADFQRGVVWDWKQKRSLLESLHLGIPMGSLYIWDVSNLKQKEIQSRDLIGISKTEAKTTGLIIDGQQRLTFLSKFKQSFDDLNSYRNSKNTDAIIVINLAKSKDKKIPVFERFQLNKEQKEKLAEVVDAPSDGDIEIEKKKQDMIFEFLLKNKNKDGESEELLWTQYILSRHKGSDSEAVKEFLKQNGVKKKVYLKIAKTFFQAINKRKFGLHMINKQAERNDCVHIYERVNKSGRRLDDMDYVEAMLTCHCPGFYDKLNEFEKQIQSTHQNGLDRNFREIKRKVVLSAILYDLYETTSRKKAMEKGLEVYHTTIPGSDNSPKDIQAKINQSFIRVKNAFIKFRELLATHLGFKNSAGFREKSQIVAVTWLIKWGQDQIKDEDSRKLLAWFIHATIFNHYSGQGTDDKADTDCKLAKSIKTPWAKLRKNIANHRQIKIADIVISEDFYEHKDYLTKNEDMALSNRSLQNSLNWTMVKYNVAKDWVSGANLTETFETDVHHIHPKSKLSGKSKRTRDHIANKCFISKETNRSVIKDRLPSEYIQKIEKIDKKRLVAQQIKIEESPTEYDKINQFIDNRKTALCKEANRILDRLQEGNDPLAEPNKFDITAEISKKEGQKIERKLRFFTQGRCVYPDCKEPSMRNSTFCYNHRDSEEISGEQGLVETKPIKSSMVREIVAFLNSRGGNLFVGVRDKPNQADPTPGLGDEIDFLYPDSDDPEERYLQRIQNYVREQITPKSAYDNNVEFKLLKQDKANGTWYSSEEIQEYEEGKEGALKLGNTILWVNVSGCLEASFDGVRQESYQKFNNKMQVTSQKNVRWIRKGELVNDADEKES